MKIIDQTEIGTLTNFCTNLFISNEWLSVITKTYGIGFKAVISDDYNFILPFCLIHDEFFSSVKSIPFGDYTLNNCGDNELNTALQLLRKNYPEHYIETSVVSKAAPSVDEFTSTKYGYLVQVDIKKWRESRDWKEAYERNIRNALNFGLVVRINKNEEALRDFYTLHEQLRINKFKKLPQPYKFFTAIYDNFIKTGSGFILEAWNSDKLIASWVILSYHDTLYYKLGASDPNYLHLRPNDLLFRSLMQYGSDNKFKTIDLGFSGAAKSYEGLIRFKSKEGGDKTPIYRVEYYPEIFPEENLKRKTKFKQEITKNALASNDLNVIRETSNRFYHKFA